jgi:hypothetical protein
MWHVLTEHWVLSLILGAIALFWLAAIIASEIVERDFRGTSK